MEEEKNQIKNKILVVEDDAMLSEIYRKKFESAGYEVLLEKNGKDAIETAKKAQPCLILLDLMMPEMDGFETLTELKKDSATSGLKVIITSNVSQEDDKKKAFELGAVDFLIKSNYELGELAEKVKSYL